jgi:hypothetical protein
MQDNVAPVLAEPVAVESSLNRICTNMMIIVTMAFLFIIALAALWRAFYWFDNKLLSSVATRNEYSAIGLAYFLSFMGIMYFVKQYSMILSRRCGF